ncbi:hypothetical protein [Microbispora bryophytorum]|uniref:hypothetical protein n=1 Tax=Microbispora bryophytorum TaxID=1460882 RepID=UPI00340C2A0A
MYGYVHAVRITCEEDPDHHYTVDGPWKLVGTSADDRSIAWCNWWDKMTWHQTMVVAYNSLSPAERAQLSQTAAP